jgi:hypothetical protein
VLQDKLSQVKDARAALDALREEERERRRREAEEAERQRQIQLAHKLELMRKKKAEYLEYQRQVHSTCQRTIVSVSNSAYHSNGQHSTGQRTVVMVSVP